MVERMADPAKEEGEWAAKIDLVEDGPRLRLAEMPQLGKCGAECKTVQRVASELLQDHDTDMAEHLFQARAPASPADSGLRPCARTGVLTGVLRDEVLTDGVLLAAQARQTRAQFSNWLCYEASAACAAKPPPLPAGRAPGPAFEVMDRQEAELEKMLAGMKVGAHNLCVFPRNHAYRRRPAHHGG